MRKMSGGEMIPEAKYYDKSKVRTDLVLAHTQKHSPIKIDESQSTKAVEGLYFQGRNTDLIK
jgi:hypothetical protein